MAGPDCEPGIKINTKEIDATDDDGLMLGADGDKLGFYGETPIEKPEVTGSRSGNVALAGLLTALGNLGLITDSTTD